jgi:hypothetical protein
MEFFGLCRISRLAGYASLEICKCKMYGESSHIKTLPFLMRAVPALTLSQVNMRVGASHLTEKDDSERKQDWGNMFHCLRHVLG